MDYFQPTPLYRIVSDDGDMSIFKALFPRVTPGEVLPRMVLKANGGLCPNTNNLPRLLTVEQEEMFLQEALMEECGLGFLSKDSTSIQDTLKYLGIAGIAYGNTFAIEDHPSHGTVVCTGQLGVQCTEIQETPINPLPQPCIVDEPITVLFKDGKTKEATMPILYLPDSYNNRRLRNGAGCLFSWGDILFQGSPGAKLHIKANINAEGIVEYRDFDLVSRTRDNWQTEEWVDTRIQQKQLWNKSTLIEHQQVPVVHLQPGNEMVAKGERYENVKTVHRICAEDTLGEEGLVVKHAESFIDEGIVQNEIGGLKKQGHNGFCGIGALRITSHAVSQKALGSVVVSKGPICIQARTGRFDATQFQDEYGREKKGQLDIVDLHFHELVKKIAKNDQEAALAFQKQAKKIKRKIRKKMLTFVASLPVSYYLGGVVLGGLSRLGFSGLKLAALKGFVMSSISSAIQGQKPKNILTRGLEGALFGGIGYGIHNATFLSNTSDFTKELIRVGSVAAIQSLLHKEKMGKNLGIAIGGAIGAEIVFPGASAPEFPKALLESSIAVLAGNGSTLDLAMNLYSSTMGSFVKPLQDMGVSHGYKVAKMCELPQPRRKPTTLSLKAPLKQEGVSHEPAKNTLLWAHRRHVQASREHYPNTGLLRTVDDFLDEPIDTPKTKVSKFNFGEWLLECLIPSAHAEELPVQKTTTHTLKDTSLQKRSEYRKPLLHKFTPSQWKQGGLHADRSLCTPGYAPEIYFQPDTHLAVLILRCKEVILKLTSDGRTGHFYMYIPVWVEETQKIVYQNIGFYPVKGNIDSVGKAIKWFMKTGFYKVPGELRSEKDDSNKGPQQLIIKKLWITTIQSSQFSKNIGQAKDNAGDYNVGSVCNANCLTFYDPKLKDIGIVDGLRNKFDYNDFQQLDFALIKLQASALFDEYKLQKLLCACGPEDIATYRHFEKQFKKERAAIAQQRITADIEQYNNTTFAGKPKLFNE